jgi:serine/threonine protein kinase
MRCPRCSFEGDLIDGACTRCGYWRFNLSGDSFSVGSVSRRYKLSSTPVPASASTPLTIPRVKRGDVLRQGRYRLIEQLMLPENQRGQGTAWLATDSQLSQGRVVIREVILPGEMPENKKQRVRSIALRLSELAQHPGFPKVLDVFSEQDDYFIVFQQIEGESLATLLRQQGGALQERTVAEYGRQLCEMLSILSRQQLPIVHGSISPETIIVSPDSSRV